MSAALPEEIRHALLPWVSVYDVAFDAADRAKLTIRTIAQSFPLGTLEPQTPLAERQPALAPRAPKWSCVTPEPEIPLAFRLKEAPNV